MSLVIMISITISAVILPGAATLHVNNSTAKNQTIASPAEINNTIGGFQQDTAGSVLLVNGKISFVYVGGEFCPYCAVERWAIVMALNEFGNFTGLGSFTSSEGNVPTYNFTTSTYNSTQVDFQPVEVRDNNANALQTMNDLQTNLTNKYDPQGSIPFTCIAGSIYKIGAGASLNYASFSGLTFNQIQSQVSAKSGEIYNQIATESQYIVEIINHLLNDDYFSFTSTTSITTTKVTNNSSSATAGSSDSNIAQTPAFELPVLILTSFILLIWKKNSKGRRN